MTAAPPNTEAWTTRRLLAWMGEAFTKKDLDSPRLLAEQLVAHVLGCERLKLYLDPDRPASPLERETLRDLVARALKHEPVQYLVGEAWFFGLPLHVDKRVLIPRPCTETIVEAVLQHHRATHGPSRVGGERAGGSASGEGVLIADVCTGSGAIAIALLKHLPAARCIATDVSADAIDVAKLNAQRHSVQDRCDFGVGDLLAPVRAFPPAAGEGSVEYLVSNPPYIPDDEWPDKVDASVREHEPTLALRGGPDGLRFVRPLIEHGPALVRPGGLMLIEVAAARAGTTLELAQAHPLLTSARILRDQDGLERVVVATRK